MLSITRPLDKTDACRKDAKWIEFALWATQELSQKASDPHVENRILSRAARLNLELNVVTMSKTLFAISHEQFTQRQTRGLFIEVIDADCLSTRRNSCKWFEILSTVPEALHPLFQVYDPKREFVYVFHMDKHYFPFLVPKDACTHSIDYSKVQFEGLEPSYSKCSFPDCMQRENQEIKFQKCSLCKTTKYCSRECQRQDWRNHKDPTIQGKCQGLTFSATCSKEQSRLDKTILKRLQTIHDVVKTTPEGQQIVQSILDRVPVPSHSIWTGKSEKKH